MTKSRKVRIKRIQSIDEKQLNAAKQKLRTLNQTIEHRRGVQLEIERRLSSTLELLQDDNSAARNNQTVAWATTTQSTLIEIQNHLQKLESTRDKLMESVRQQRSKVEGWQLLLEKIASEERAASEKESIFAADDQFARKTSVKNRRSK